MPASTETQKAMHKQERVAIGTVQEPDLGVIHVVLLGAHSGRSLCLCTLQDNGDRNQDREMVEKLRVIHEGLENLWKYSETRIPSAAACKVLNERRHFLLNAFQQHQQQHQQQGQRAEPPKKRKLEQPTPPPSPAKVQPPPPPAPVITPQEPPVLPHKDQPPEPQPQQQEQEDVSSVASGRSRKRRKVGRAKKRRERTAELAKEDDTTDEAKRLQEQVLELLED